MTYQDNSEVFNLALPTNSKDPAPIFFDSPHSGTDYPADFDYVVPVLDLRTAEDAFIDDLYSEVPNLGAILIDANFPRIFLDTNRSDLDFSHDHLEDTHDGILEPSQKVDMGKGLIWTRVINNSEIYDRKITAAELIHRVESYWKPYHTAIETTFMDLHAKHGYAYHVNCHSMPKVSTIHDPEGPMIRADFVLGDRDGTTCEPGFTHAARDHLVAQGFSVEINFPYKGAELVRRYSDPSNHLHSLQIEINRSLYMDEKAIEKRADYEAFKPAITNLAATLIDYAKARNS